jgi:hypothetical protein
MSIKIDVTHSSSFMRKQNMPRKVGKKTKKTIVFENQYSITTTPLSPLTLMKLLQYNFPNGKMTTTI